MIVAGRVEIFVVRVARILVKKLWFSFLGCETNAAILCIITTPCPATNFSTKKKINVKSLGRENEKMKNNYGARFFSV